MIEIKALCAVCGPDLYFEEWPMRYLADGQWVEVAGTAEAIDLALAGVQLKTVNDHTMRPRAQFLVNGTALCGLCIRSIGANTIRTSILYGRPFR